ncbi:MAG TPA: glycoside hydrolase family 2 TIM barrel-domain containing protein [Polyangiaceae bacterium]|nr:glycoside hydrolase family 2 TIM barrel-domain containing protein [Polyangiaceae bacterium]
MTPRYRDHVRRRVIDLSGVWDFVFLGPVDPHAIDPRSLVFDGAMPVPGCFDATPEFAARRGVAAYRTHIPLPLLEPLAGARRWRVEIDGAHHYSLAYLDGVPIGTHAGGFTRFCHDVDASAIDRLVEAGEHDRSIELILLVDNAFSPRSPLHLEHFDWYHYGGISRGVRWHRLPATWIERVESHTVSLDPPVLELRVHYQTLEPEQPVRLGMRWDGRDLPEETLLLRQPSGILVRRIELPGAALWSPDAPHLHRLHVHLGDDDLVQRIGLRTIEVRDRRLCINGTPLRCRGINRHESHPSFGHAVPDAVQISDLHWLRRLGVNLVRGSHYPQSEAFLDACDELGICVWNEAIGWQHPREQLLDERFIAAQSDHIEEMLATSQHHPSIITWGLLNESASDDPECRPSYEKLIALIRARDPSRPVTYATNRAERDVCLDLVDIVSVNTYPGWYFDTLENIPRQLDHLLASMRHLAPNAPLLVAEIGAAAIPGFADQNGQHWTEEYQAKVIDSALEHLLAPGTDCVGVCIWHFADCRVGQNARAAMGRPRGFNNKGLLDEYRRPKRAFEVAARHFQRGAQTADDSVVPEAAVPPVVGALEEEEPRSGVR